MIRSNLGNYSVLVAHHLQSQCDHHDVHADLLFPCILSHTYTHRLRSIDGWIDKYFIDPQLIFTHRQQCSYPYKATSLWTMNELVPVKCFIMTWHLSTCFCAILSPGKNKIMNIFGHELTTQYVGQAVENWLGSVEHTEIVWPYKAPIWDHFLSQIFHWWNKGWNKALPVHSPNSLLSPPLWINKLHFSLLVTSITH